MIEWNEATYNDLAPYRSRPLDELEKRLGDITSLIDDLLARGGRPRILEIGHGFGSVLVQLLLRYGSRIELHAISIEKYWGSWDVITRNAVQMDLATETELAELPQPIIHTADLNLGLPFAPGFFSFVFSQVSFFLVREKLHLIAECARVVDGGGTAWIDVNPLEVQGVPAELASLLDIRSSSGPVPFWSFVRLHPWLVRREAPMRDFLEIKSQPAPKFAATLVSAIDLHLLSSHWYGTKSIYDFD